MTEEKDKKDKKDLKEPKKKRKTPHGRHTQDFWEKGQIPQLAELTNMSRQNVYNILARKKGVSPQTAALLEQASRAILGFPIAWSDWVLSKSTDHPAFKPLTPGITASPKPPLKRPLSGIKRVYIRDIINKIPYMERLKLMHDIGPEIDPRKKFLKRKRRKIK